MKGKAAKERTELRRKRDKDTYETGENKPLTSNDFYLPGHGPEWGPN